MRSACRPALFLAVGLGACGSPAVSSRPVSRNDSLITVGEQAYYRGEFDSARSMWQQALALARPGDSLTEPRVLTWLGLAAYRQGDYPTSRRLGERALALKLDRDLRPELGKSYNALGLVAWNEGRLAEAGKLFRSALDQARLHADRDLIARSGNNLGLLQTELGAFDDARRNFVAARVAGRALEDARMEGGALNNIGMLDVWLGNHDKALEPLLQAQRLYRTVGYETGQENVFGQLGVAYAALGQPHRSFAALDSALAISRKEGMRVQEASNLETIAALYWSFGDGQRALEVYALAQVINRELNLQVELANGLRNEAAIRSSAGLLAPARTGAEAALRGHRAAGARFEELHDLLLLADIAGRQKTGAATNAYLDDAERVAVQLRAPIARAQVALTRARLADRHRNGRLVLQVLQSARPHLERSLSGSAWEVEALRARAYHSLGQLDSAASVGRRSVSAIERVRVNLGSGPLHNSYLGARAAVYADLALVLIRLGREEEAFEVADGARSRALLQHLPTVRARIQRKGSARDVAEAEALLRKIDALLARLAEAEETVPEERGPESVALTGELAHRLQQARSEYESILTRITSQPAATAEAPHGRRTPTGAALASDEALLQYLVTHDRVLIFVLTSSTLRVLESPIAESDLVARVRLARELIGKRQAAPGESREVTEGLHRVLLTPVIRSGALAAAKKVAIVPHGVLNYLPFAALRDPSSGRALVETYSLWLVPTASAMGSLRRDPGIATARLASVRGVAYAPFPEQLPATRAEVASFSRATHRRGVRLGGDASEADLRSALSRGDLVHVASHGVLNAVNPLFSGIELARRTGRPDNDGRLEVHELLELPVRSPLVYLSGCETGLGLAWSTDFARGEDYTTLAQSFLYAGARNVVATLWRIEDAGAAVFAGRFYHHLQQLPPREALAAAQRDMMRDLDYAAPYYWAAYFLTGEGS